MSRKPVQKERRRQIMEALHRCLLVKPFDKTSIKDIAAEAGINHGMLHYYFKSKDDILIHYIEFIIEKYKSMFDQWLAERDRTDETPESFVTACFDIMYHRITLNQDISRIFIEIWEISTYNPQVREKLRAAYENWISTLSGAVEQHMADRASARLISAGLVAFLEGLSMLSVIYEGGEFPLETLLAKAKGLISEMLAQKGHTSA